LIYAVFGYPLTPVFIGKRQTDTALAVTYNRPHLPRLIRRFLYDQLHGHLPSADADLPAFHEQVRIHRSAVATFYAPSDPSGIGGMRRERIRAVPTWRKGPGRYDCIFVVTDESLKGMRGLDIARAQLFLSFPYRGTMYQCALVHWFSRVDDEPDDKTGMWIVEPEFYNDGTPVEEIIHVDCIIRAAHLIGVYGEAFVHRHLTLHDSLDAFESYFVNKYIDHHAFEIAF
jgi:hypothetical protein